MPVSPRIKAQNIKFLIADVEYACDATAVELTLGDAPGDVQTFCEVRVGGEWALMLEGITSGDATSLYRVLWNNFGTTATFVIAPSGNAAATTSEPHYSGVVRFNEIPPLSLNTNETSTFSVTLEVVNTPNDVDTDVYYGVSVVTA
jgi:hypothetical protein